MNKEFPFDMTNSNKIDYQPDYYDKELSLNNLYNGISQFHLKTSIISCDTCRIHESNFRLSFNNMKADLMIIGSTPEDVYYKSSNGEILASGLKQLQYDFDDIYLTSIKKSENATAVCEKHLISEVVVVNPLIIIALGYNVGSHLVDSIQYPGQGFTLVNGSNLLVTHSLTDILENSYLYQEFISHMQLAHNQLHVRKQQRSFIYAGV